MQLSAWALVAPIERTSSAIVAPIGRSRYSDR
jgi:hypothetical protein